MTTPALQRLRERFPKATITILTDEKLRDLWEHHPSINSILTFARHEEPWSVARRLRRHGFDAALVLPNSVRSALEAWLAGIPNRIGYQGRWRSLFLTRTLQRPPNYTTPRRRSLSEIKRLVSEHDPGIAPGHFRHQVDDYLWLTATLGAKPTELPPRLEITEPETESVLDWLRTLLTSGGHRPTHDAVWLGMNASAAFGPAKCWPADRFAQVARVVRERIPNCVWLSFGSHHDERLSEALSSPGTGTVLDLAGKTSLRQLMVLLKKCKVLLTNDSGPMHVAAALGTPVVVPFGSTSPDLTGPVRSGILQHQVLQARAPCSPCFRRTCPIDFRCMTGIEVDQVTAAVLKAVGR